MPNQSQHKKEICKFRLLGNGNPLTLQDFLSPVGLR
jgi:hypothetical protein